MLILRPSRNHGLKNKWRSNMRTVCPKCHGEVELPLEVENGQHVTCSHCGHESSLRVQLSDIDSRQDDDKSEAAAFYVATTGREYEECISNYLKANGYKCTLTPESGDQGVDVIVHLENVDIAIQCKMYSMPVGNEAVQEVAAGAVHYNCGVACVVSNSSFTASAVSLAASNNVRLLHHSQLLEFISEIQHGQSNVNNVSPDFESSDEYKALVERAGQGFEEERTKLGDYYVRQMKIYVGEDLIVASEYLVKACRVGHLYALFAFMQQYLAKQTGNREYELKEDDPFKFVIDDMLCDGPASIPESTLEDINTEFEWARVRTSVLAAAKMPKGRQRDATISEIAFVHKYELKEDQTAKRMFYLGQCYLMGFGCEQNLDVAAYYLNYADCHGYHAAGDFLRIIVNGSVEKGKQIISDKWSKVVRRVKCLKCDAVVSTASKKCWRCEAPIVNRLPSFLTEI